MFDPHPLLSIFSGPSMSAADKLVLIIYGSVMFVAAVYFAAIAQAFFGQLRGDSVNRPAWLRALPPVCLRAVARLCTLLAVFAGIGSAVSLVVVL